VLLYLGILIIHPGIAYDRYIVPITPLLTFFVVTELAIPISGLKKELWSGGSLIGKVTSIVIGLALLVTTCTVVYSNLSAIRQSLGSVEKTLEPRFNKDGND
jgi:hypothetical protein